MARQRATRNPSPYNKRDGMAKRPGCPCSLCGFLFIRDVLYEVAGLTVQGSANLIQDVNGNMLCSTGTQRRDCGLTDGLANPVRNPWSLPGCADFAALCALDDGNEARCHGKDGCFPLNCGHNCGQNVYKPAVFAEQTCRNRRIKQKILHRNAGFVVEHTGFEPVTSTMRM